MRFTERLSAPWARRASCVGAVLLASCSSAPVPERGGVPPPAPPGPSAAPPPLVGAVRARNWEQLRLFAAQRMVEANPALTYTGTPPDILLAIPVLEIELNADGSIRRIDVLRHPSQARDTTQLAIDAVRRAAPFGDVSRLPRPWKFVETFLFNDDRRFKPRTLDG